MSVVAAATTIAITAAVAAAADAGLSENVLTDDVLG